MNIINLQEKNLGAKVMKMVMKKLKMITQNEMERLNEITREYIDLTVMYMRSCEKNKSFYKNRLVKLKEERDAILNKKQEIWENIKQA